MSQTISQESLSITGQTGANAGTRYIGATVSGYPQQFTALSGYAPASLTLVITGSLSSSAQAMAIDSSRNVYITTNGTTPLLKIPYGTLSGVQIIGTTFSGINTTNLWQPAFDAQQNMWIANYGVSCIMKAPSGTNAFSVVLSGNANGASINGPTAIAFDNQQNLWIGNYNNNTLLKVNSGTTTASLVLSGATGNPSTPWINPININFDKQGNLYSTNWNNNNIYRVASGTTTVTYIPTSGTASTVGIVFDSQQNIWFDQFNTNVLQVIASGTNSVTTVLSGNANAYQLSTPTALASDIYNNIWFMNQANYTLLYYNAGASGIASTVPYTTGDVAVDQTGGRVWVNTSGGYPGNWGASLTGTTAQIAGKNKIINGDFGIWQRGTSFNYNTSSGLAAQTYNADRWIFDYSGTGNSWTVSQQTFPNGVTLPGYNGGQPTYYAQVQCVASGTASTFWEFDQRIENARLFNGQQVTLSFWAKADINRTLSYIRIDQVDSSGTLNQIASNIALTPNWKYYSITATMPLLNSSTGFTSTGYLRLVMGNNVAPVAPLGATYSFWGVQLEAGPVPTQFSTAAGTIQGELALCQRYFWLTQPGTSSAVAFGTAQATTSIFFSVPNPVTMRQSPTISTSGTFWVNDGANQLPVSTLQQVGGLLGTAQTSWVQASGSSYTQFRPYFLYTTSSTSYLGFNAEL